MGGERLTEIIEQNTANSGRNTEKDIINVVDEFDYSTQNDIYNDKFKKWRRDKNNPYAFNFVANKKESVFIDGQGFVSRSSSYSERETINRIFFIAGVAMLIWVSIENIFSKIIIFIFGLLGFDIHTTFFSDSVYGGSKGIVTALIVTEIIKNAVPAVYLHKKLKMPMKLELMSTMNDTLELINALAMTFMACAITSIPTAYSNNAKEIYSFFRRIDTDVSVWGQEEYVIYTVFDIIVISVLSEILFRGAIFTALRQFGDIFAIVITSIMAGLLSQDFREMPAVMIISAVSGIGMLRSGSIFTAFSVRILYKMYQLSLAIIEVDTSEDMFIIRNLAILGFFSLGALVVLLIRVRKINQKRSYFALYNGETPLKERAEYIMHSFPFPAVAIVCLLAALIKFLY